MSNKQILFSILRYLDSLKQSRAYDDDTLQSVDVAIECLAGLENLDMKDEEVEN
jgi:hypothetical protein